MTTERWGSKMMFLQLDLPDRIQSAIIVVENKKTPKPQPKEETRNKKQKKWL